MVSQALVFLWIMLIALLASDVLGDDHLWGHRSKRRRASILLLQLMRKKVPRTAVMACLGVIYDEEITGWLGK